MQAGLFTIQSVYLARPATINYSNLKE